jgi:hypothetical protein
MNETHTDNPDGKRFCPQCGAAFVCGCAAAASAAGEFHCWCFDLPPVMAVRADTACLCPACLARAIQQAQVSQETHQ